MSHQTSLLGGSHSKQISKQEGFSLSTPGFQCTVTEKGQSGGGVTRGQEKITPVDGLLEKLDKEHAIVIGSFDIEITGRADKGSGAVTRSGGGPSSPVEEGPMILDAKKRVDNMGCAVMHIDKHGACSWIFPKEETSEKFSFELPKEKGSTNQDSGATTRGPITAGIRKVVKIFAWLTDGIVGATALAAAKSWEESHRPYTLNMLNENGEGQDIDWKSFHEKPSLLLLHGTFSTWESAFHGLFQDQPSFKALYDKYEGRIMAFNHPSLHKSPAENVQELFKMIPDGQKLNLDIITHSRGGLVGRELIERYDEYNHSGFDIKVNKAILVAAPNQGTILTDRDNWIKLIDCYTNLVTTLPDNIGTIILESVITLVKVVGGGAVKGLPGLQAMLPSGDHIKRLNDTASVETIYYAIGANYNPNDEKLLARFGKKLLMKVLAKVFGEESDMVVPTNGSFTTGKDNGGFPIPKDRQKLYMLEQDVNHVNFFDHFIVNNTLVKWLG